MTHTRACDRAMTLLLLPLFILAAPAPLFAEDDAYAITRRLNMQSVMRTEGLYENTFNNEHGGEPPHDFWVRTGYWIVGTGGNQSRHGDHHVAQTAVSATYALLQQRLDVMGDFRASVTLAIDQGSLARAAGFFFHYIDGSFTWVELDKKQNLVAAYTWDGTRETLLASVSLSLWKRDWQKLSVSVHEGTALVRVQKSVVLAFPIPKDRDVGYCGLLTRVNTKARFDEFELRFDKRLPPTKAAE